MDERFDPRWLCDQPEAWLVIDHGTQMSFAVFTLGHDKNRAIIASAMMQTPVFLHKTSNCDDDVPKTMDEMSKWFGDSNGEHDGTTLAFCWLWCFNQETLMDSAQSSEWSAGHFKINVQAWREALISEDGMTNAKRELAGLQAQLIKLKDEYSAYPRAVEHGWDTPFTNTPQSIRAKNEPESDDMRALYGRIAGIENKIRHLRTAATAAGSPTKHP